MSRSNKYEIKFYCPSPRQWKESNNKIATQSNFKLFNFFKNDWPYPKENMDVLFAIYMSYEICKKPIGCGYFENDIIRSLMKRQARAEKENSFFEILKLFWWCHDDFEKSKIKETKYGYHIINRYANNIYEEDLLSILQKYCKGIAKYRFKDEEDEKWSDWKVV